MNFIQTDITYLEQIKLLTDKDLKGTISLEDKVYLKANPTSWRSELVCLKRRTEMQFTSSKARSFSLYKDFKEGILSSQEYDSKLYQEKEWRVNAARFLQQIEFRIQETRSLDESSDQ